MYQIALSLSYKFVKTKDWRNQHDDYYKAQQNLEYTLTGLHLSKAFLSGLMCWGGVYFQENLFGEYKNNLDQSEKS